MTHSRFDTAVVEDSTLQPWYQEMCPLVRSLDTVSPQFHTVCIFFGCTGKEKYVTYAFFYPCEPVEHNSPVSSRNII